MSESKLNNTIDEIDLVYLVKLVWVKKWFITKFTLVFMVLGVLVAILTPKEFEASSTFIPQTGESSKGENALGGLASLAGINLGGGAPGSEIPPTLYPKIVSSVTFQKALLEAKLTVDGLESPISYKDYYQKYYSPGVFEGIKKYTIGLPGLLLNSIKSEVQEELIKKEDGIIRVSREEHAHFKRLATQLKVTPNEKEGVVSINFVMPDPLMAAEMAKFAEILLQKEIIQFKIQNANEQLKFTEERFLEKKTEFEEAQRKLAYFRDRNQDLASASVLNQLQKLEAEYNFTFGVYTELAKQVEQAKMQVAKDTPVLSVIQPVTVPIEKANLSGSILLLLFTFVGLFFSISYILTLEFLSRLGV